jgi:hypothetical protein
MDETPLLDEETNQKKKKKPKMPKKKKDLKFLNQGLKICIGTVIVYFD